MDRLQHVINLVKLKTLETSSLDPRDLVSLGRQSLWISIAACLFNPIFWNCVAQSEYRSHWLTRATGGAHRGCYLLALVIFSLGILRDHLFNEALKEQPRSTYLANDAAKAVAVVCAGTGFTLVTTSMWALGVTGTYLGDYFGILMDHMVTSFPFNVTKSPMYDGSSLLFLATALWHASPAGLFITALVFVEYRIALQFEDKFTSSIYANRSQSKAVATSGRMVTRSQSRKSGLNKEL